jgi:hypothetical protein
LLSGLRATISVIHFSRRAAKEYSVPRTLPKHGTWGKLKHLREEKQANENWIEEEFERIA